MFTELLVTFVMLSPQARLSPDPNHPTPDLYTNSHTVKSGVKSGIQRPAEHPRLTSQSEGFRLISLATSAESGG